MVSSTISLAVMRASWDVFCNLSLWKTCTRRRQQPAPPPPGGGGHGGLCLVSPHTRDETTKGWPRNVIVGPQIAIFTSTGGHWIKSLPKKFITANTNSARSAITRGGGRILWGVGRRHCRAEPITDSERSHGRGSDLELVTTE